MKTSISLLSFCLTLALVSPTVRAETEECVNCQVEVTVRRDQAQRLAAIVAVISSMPLNGTVIAEYPETGTALVRISTYAEYAAQNGLDSFDVARRVRTFVDQGFGITQITASVEFKKNMAESVSNVGTIGHP